MIEAHWVYSQQPGRQLLMDDIPYHLTPRHTARNLLFLPPVLCDVKVPALPDTWCLCRGLWHHHKQSEPQELDNSSVASQERLKFIEIQWSKRKYAAGEAPAPFAQWNDVKCFKLHLAGFEIWHKSWFRRKLVSVKDSQSVGNWGIDCYAQIPFKPKACTSTVCLIKTLPT